MSERVCGVCDQGPNQPLLPKRFGESGVTEWENGARQEAGLPFSPSQTSIASDVRLRFVTYHIYSHCLVLEALESRNACCQEFIPLIVDSDRRDLRGASIA